MNLTLDLAEIINSDRGFTITGADLPDEYDVSSGGDLNGDGLDDIIIGAFVAGNQRGDGEAYVVFGQANNPNNINVNNLNGSNGFTISDTDGTVGLLGDSVSIGGDFNGDGFEDAIVGAPLAGDLDNSGEAYIVFGQKDGFASNFDINSLNGNNGFKIAGLNSVNNLGTNVSDAGDINGDGISDLIVGAPAVQVNDNGTNQGQTYVIFGTNQGFEAEFNLNDLNGNNGFTISGSANYDFIGNIISDAGDINGDGFDDVIVAHPTFSTTLNGNEYISDEGRAISF